MSKSIGSIEFKSIAKGIEATDAALKSAGIRLVSSHPACPGKYEMIITGTISNVSAAVDHVKERFGEKLIDSSIMGRIDEQVITALFRTVAVEKSGSLGIIETYSASSAIKAADIAVKTAKVEIFELRVSRGMGGKGMVLITGDVGDVTAAVEAGAQAASRLGELVAQHVIPRPHGDVEKILPII